MARYYFLGVGGIGMSAIARYLKMQGNDVYGYDRTPSDLTHQLEKEGIVINYEDKKENIPSNIDYIIYTPAIPNDSEQMQYLSNSGIPMEKRSVALGHITSNKKVLAVSGTHGKTTTCGMIAHILSSSPVGCSAFLGGILKSVDNNFLFNKDSQYVVVEADEYDRSFLQLRPYASVITAIDADHMDIYHTYENLHKAFEDFASLTSNEGLLLVKNTRKEIVSQFEKTKNVRTYSFDDKEACCFVPDYRVENGKYFFDYVCDDCKWDNIEMSYPGKHNIENMVAAISICRFVLQKEGYSLEDTEKIIREGVKTFSGMKRRLDYIHRADNAIFIDDYAHHPNEISATISSLREMYPEKHFTGIFQPHLYSRTKDFADGFAEALSLLDTAILLPIYPARELPIEGVNSEMILERMTIKDKTCTTKQDLLPMLKSLKPEFLITFGAGDIDRMLKDIQKVIE